MERRASDAAASSQAAPVGVVRTLGLAGGVMGLAAAGGQQFALVLSGYDDPYPVTLWLAYACSALAVVGSFLLRPGRPRVAVALVVVGAGVALSMNPVGIIAAVLVMGAALWALTAWRARTGGNRGDLPQP